MTDDAASGPGEVRLQGRLICRSAEDAQIVAAHLPEHVRLTRAEPGCLSFTVTPTEDPLIWHVEERFRDKAAFAIHQERSRASAWWAATAHIPRDYEILGLD